MISQLQIIDIDKEYVGYVITSDGLHDFLDEEAIEDFATAGIFTENSFKDLIQQAKEQGSADDMSIIVIKLWE